MFMPLWVAKEAEGLKTGRQDDQRSNNQTVYV